MLISSGMLIADSGSGIRIFFYPGSRIRIRNAVLRGMDGGPVVWSLVVHVGAGGGPVEGARLQADEGLLLCADSPGGRVVT